MTQAMQQQFQEIIDKIPEKCLDKHNLIAVYLFGSVAQGTAGPLSDIDFGVLLPIAFTKEKLYDANDKIFLDLANYISSERLDVVVLNLAPLRIQFEVVTTGRLIYSKDDSVRADYESYILRKYEDFRRYDEEYRRVFIERVKEEFSEAQRKEYHDTFAKVKDVHRRIKEVAKAQSGRIQRR